jgi:hypothetical protein
MDAFSEYQQRKEAERLAWPETLPLWHRVILKAYLSRAYGQRRHPNKAARIARRYAGIIDKYLEAK